MKQMITRILITLAGSAAMLSAEFQLFETFEDRSMVVGESLIGLNGWEGESDSTVLVQRDPLSQRRGNVAQFAANSASPVSRNLGGLSILDSQVGTLFFELLLTSSDVEPNLSIGLSDVVGPTAFGDFEAQFRIVDSGIAPRDGPRFVDTGFSFAVDEWMQVWVVVDNQTNTLDIFMASSEGDLVQTQVANDLSFRNGDPENTLRSFFVIQASQRQVFLDNIFVDSTQENLSVPQLPQFRPFEDFEDETMLIGETFIGNNGWEGDLNASAGALVQNDPLDDGRGKVAELSASSNFQLFRDLGELSIADGASGTLFFELLFLNSGETPNISIGLSDLANPSGFGSFESQFRVFGDLFQPRDGSVFTNTGFQIAPNQWMQVWVTVDNEANTLDIYVASPAGGNGITLIASELSFRNGAATEALRSFFAIQTSERLTYLDNIFLDPSGVNLGIPQFPNLPEPAPIANNDFVEVGVNGSLRFAPLENDSGSFDSSSVTIVSGPTNGTARLISDSGEIVYQHNGGQGTSDFLRYRISNRTGTESAEADVIVNINRGLNIQNVTTDIPLTPPASSSGSLVVRNALPGLTFDNAVAIASIPGSPRALFVASIRGNVWYIPDTTDPNPTRHEVLNVAQLSNFTRGRSIYSIECYPDFATTGHVIITYQGDTNRLPMTGGGQFDTEVITGLDRDGAPDFTIECDLRISRFTLSPSHIQAAMTNGLSSGENGAALDTEYPFLNLAEQHLFHSINDAKFGPDGYLYVSFGDEGDQGSPYRNDQLLTKDQYGAIIRIDVDPASTNPLPNPHYSIAVGQLSAGGPRNLRTHGFYTDPENQTPNFRIPEDNPFLHASQGGTANWNGTYNNIDLSDELELVRSEIWAFGLRNPFKFHLDIEDGTGEVEAWVGDVGKSSREEFTILKKGENAGWAAWEGSIRTPGLDFTPIEPSGITPHKPPLYDYPHGSTGNSATGGIFYRETALSQLTNRYVCGDYGSGRIWSVGRDGSVTELVDLRFGRADIVDFNLDAETHDIFILEHSSDGRVMRLTEESETEVEDFPQTLTDTGIFASLEDLSPNPGVIPYDVNLTFWSDGADKQRWFALQNTTDRIGYSRDGNWDFPEGMIWVKHFDYDLDLEAPGTNVKRLETRLLVRNSEGSYGVSYRWNDEGTEANLADISGEQFPITFTQASGEIETFEWEVPSRAACSTCHTATGGHGLSFNTRQLNIVAELSGQTGNQVSLLSQSGILEGLNDSISTLPRHFRPDELDENLEARVRSYLAVNCAYCHQPNGGAPESWDAREHLSLVETNILYGNPESEATPDLTDHIVRPGDKLNSSIWNKINARTLINGEFEGYTQMPPLASNRFDDEGIAIIREWIDNYANTQPTLVGDGSSLLSENSGVNDIANPLIVTDRDVRNNISDQSRLTYSIVSGNDDRLFRLNEQTGELIVNGILDFERQPQHNLLVEITDNFSVNPGLVRHNLQINLVDETLVDLTEDLNGNHIHDFFETTFGVSGLNGSDDSTDRDGTSLFFEFLSGGDPLVAESPSSLGLTLSADSRSPTATLSWRVRNGLVIDSDYRLRSSGNLFDWADLGPADYEIIAQEDDGPGVSRIWVRVPRDSHRFFRLEEP